MNKRIEAICQEIERRRHDYGKRMLQPDGMVARAKFDELTGLLAFIDSLPEEEPSKELEEVASREGFDYVDNIVHESPEHRWNDHDVEFGYRDGFIAGAKWQKEQLK